MTEDGKSSRLAGRRPDAHDRAGGDERFGVRGQGPKDRSHHEHRDAEEHHSFAAEAVAQSAEGEHEAGEEQSVCVDHPLYLRDGSVKGGL
jgi:hypothetical protein